MVPIAVNRFYDHRKSYKEKHLIKWLAVSEASPIFHYGGTCWHAGRHGSGEGPAHGKEAAS